MAASRRQRLGCSQFHQQLKMERRAFLKAGVLGTAGLSLANVLQAEAAEKANPKLTRNNAKSGNRSVIILWMRGGPSQHETWDPKPNAPAEYRGAFGSMSTRVPGLQICDLLPLSARCMDKWSVIRSLHHTNAGHSAGDQILFTGYPPPKSLQPEGPGNIRPSCGSIVAKQLQHKNPKLPAYVMIPRMVPGTGSAYLGPAYNPFETISDPASGGSFKVRNFQLPSGVNYDRVGSRKQLLKDMDRLRRTADNSGQMNAMDQFQQQAWEIVTGPEARNAFDLDAEPQHVRKRYGFLPPFKAPTPDRCGVPAWSQRFVLARRLIEAGVRLVTVDCRWWDTHVEGVDSMRRGFLPRWDKAYSALIEDLDERGLLESTMVIAWGEFGRTPKINQKNGRDHYPNVFSAALAGGGIQGGRAIGQSDRLGAFPKSNAKKPQDVLATMYRHLGVDTHVHYLDPAGRPIPVLTDGKPVDELF